MRTTMLYWSKASPIKEWNRYSCKYFSSTYRINCSRSIWWWGTTDAWNNNMAWIKGPQWVMLQDQGYDHRMNHNQSEATCDSHPHIWNEVWKGKRHHSDNKLSEVIDRFSKIHNDEQLRTMEMDSKNTEPKVIPATENMDTVCNERPTQSTANKTLNKKVLCGQIQNRKAWQDQNGSPGNQKGYAISRALCH